MMFSEIIVTYWKNHIKRKYTVWGKFKFFFIGAAFSTYTYQ